MTPKSVWVAERKARRVPGRTWALKLLRRMVPLRPPPPFDPSEEVKLFVVDQTYARTGGSGVGITRYRAVETLDAAGDRNNRETRLVYMNGLERPVALRLSAAAAALIDVWGPYTQSFDRVALLLQPQRVQEVQRGLFRRTLLLLRGALDERDLTTRLLRRPAAPTLATYLNWLTPLPNVDTKSYRDMFAIVRWCMQHVGVKPLVLGVLGDGQTVLRLRDTKRRCGHERIHVLTYLSERSKATVRSSLHDAYTTSLHIAAWTGTPHSTNTFS